MCVGEKYQLSAACRLECEYASVLKKPIVPVKTRECVPSGWLGLILVCFFFYFLNFFLFFCIIVIIEISTK